MRTKIIFWQAHQRFFRSMCVSAKTNKAIAIANEALSVGYCCVIGLQSTGESQTNQAGGSQGAVCVAKYELQRVSE